MVAGGKPDPASRSKKCRREKVLELELIVMEKELQQLEMELREQ